MMELEADAIAWYQQGGVELINSMLNVEYPSTRDRNDALQELEGTGRWRVLWHREGPAAAPAFGIVVEYLGK